MPRDHPTPRKTYFRVNTETNINFVVVTTVKPVYNDHLYNKIY